MVKKADVRRAKSILRVFESIGPQKNVKHYIVANLIFGFFLQFRDLPAHEVVVLYTGYIRDKSLLQEISDLQMEYNDPRLVHSALNSSKNCHSINLFYRLKNQAYSERIKYIISWKLTHAIDIPPKMGKDLSKFRATLGHKVNHSFESHSSKSGGSVCHVNAIIFGGS